MTAKKIQPNYINYLPFEYMMNDLELFGEVPYKYLAKYYKKDPMDVQIIDLECDRVGWCKTLFKFTLESNKSEKEFETILEYRYGGEMSIGLMSCEEEYYYSYH